LDLRCSSVLATEAPRFDSCRPAADQQHSPNVRFGYDPPDGRLKKGAAARVAGPNKRKTAALGKIEPCFAAFPGSEIDAWRHR
jgi:hypothetical protein